MTTNSIGNACRNDFLVTRADNAGTAKSTTEHLTDQAGSQACQVISVAGTTADDAYTRLSIGATATYALGIDNSDSDKFKIAYHADSATPSSTALWTSTIAGEVSKPLQPTFLAQNAARTDITGDGTIYTLSLGHAEIFDVGGNLAAGVFTAPVTGKYLIGGQITLAGVNQDGLQYRTILATSNREYYSTWVRMWGISDPDTKLYASHGSILADMDAGDEARIRMVATGGTKTYDLSGVELSYMYGDLVL